MKPFLLEIGTEEIPARFLPEGINSIKERISRLFENALIGFREARVFATPRRLAVLVEEVSERQKDKRTEIFGPPKKIAFDEKGNPTKAAIGFVKSQNVDIKDLKIVATEKGEYVAAIIEEKGRETSKVLSELLPEFIRSIHFPKSMRWGNGTLRFARPIRWITALYGEETIHFEIDGLKSSNLTRGHRFLSSGNIQIQNPSNYLSLLSNSFVIVNPEVRKEMILKGMEEIETKINCIVIKDKELLETVTFLVEYPTVNLGDFNTVYLSLPKELLITVMKSHQKYFSVEDKNGSLLPHFIAVSNTKAENSDIVRNGTERVLRARLEDARFYYEDDQKKPLEDYVEKLKGVTFYEKLGNLYEKAERIASISSTLADILHMSRKEKLIRAAMLSKADLVTGVVREFPELQGYMGMVYAKTSGEDEDVALAIYEHYMPRFAGDSLPATEMGKIISIADKIDNITSFFSLELTPTGSEDPFALRRQATGIINILQNSGYPITLDLLIEKALDLIGCHPSAKTELCNKILGFFAQRFEGILLDKGYSYDFINAVFSTGISNINDIKQRIEILSIIKGNPEFPSLLLAAKRVYNILANVKTEQLQEDILTEPVEKELFKAVINVSEKLKDTNFMALFKLINPINSFFDKVLIMDKDLKIRQNRLALLFSVKKTFDSLADFSKIVG